MRREEPHGRKFAVGSVPGAGSSIFALASRDPAAGQKFLSHGPALLDRSEMWRQDAINIFGAHAEGLLTSKEPIGGCQTADDDDVRMQFRWDGRRHLRQDFSGRDFFDLVCQGVLGRLCSSICKNSLACASS